MVVPVAEGTAGDLEAGKREVLRPGSWPSAACTSHHPAGGLFLCDTFLCQQGQGLVLRDLIQH